MSIDRALRSVGDGTPPEPLTTGQIVGLAATALGLWAWAVCLRATRWARR